MSPFFPLPRLLSVVVCTVNTPDTFKSSLQEVEVTDTSWVGRPGGGYACAELASQCLLSSCVPKVSANCLSPLFRVQADTSLLWCSGELEKSHATATFSTKCDFPWLFSFTGKYNCPGKVLNCLGPKQQEHTFLFCFEHFIFSHRLCVCLCVWPCS